MQQPRRFRFYEKNQEISCLPSHSVEVYKLKRKLMRGDEVQEEDVALLLQKRKKQATQNLACSASKTSTAAKTIPALKAPAADKQIQTISLSKTPEKQMTIKTISFFKAPDKQKAAKTISVLKASDQQIMTKKVGCEKVKLRDLKKIEASANCIQCKASTSSATSMRCFSKSCSSTICVPCFQNMQNPVHNKENEQEADMQDNKWLINCAECLLQTVHCPLCTRLCSDKRHWSENRQICSLHWCARSRRCATCENRS